MSNFDHCITAILTEEGGLVNHSRDPGGLTKFGISQRSYPDLDIASITLDQAKALYKRDYWDVINGHQFSKGLALLLLDCAINQGPVTAITLLQAALDIHQDGIPGPMTQSMAAVKSPEVLTDFCAERALRYEFNRNEAVFGRGWYRRLLRMHRLAWSWMP